MLHAFEQAEGVFETKAFARLLKLAAGEGEWELCAELARFLVGIDGSGETLKAVLAEAGLRDGVNGGAATPGVVNGTSNGSSAPSSSHGSVVRAASVRSPSGQTTPGEAGVDYFSMGPYV